MSFMGTASGNPVAKSITVRMYQCSSKEGGDKGPVMSMAICVKCSVIMGYGIKRDRTNPTFG